MNRAGDSLDRSAHDRRQKVVRGGHRREGVREGGRVAVLAWISTRSKLSSRTENGSVRSITFTLECFSVLRGEGRMHHGPVIHPRLRDIIDSARLYPLVYPLLLHETRPRIVRNKRDSMFENFHDVTGRVFGVQTSRVTPRARHAPPNATRDARR